MLPNTLRASRWTTPLLALAITIGVAVATVSPTAATATATTQPSSSATSAVLSSSLTRVDQSIVKAADLSLFRPGNIISDTTFFNSGTMTAAQIDAFFRSKVTTCQSGYVCLKDYRQNTPNRGADQYCNGYSGAANESAASIIYKVAQSCGINPQVFIVMLQKEQGLVTHTWPSSWRYDKALGQGCPDTAPCDPAYAGFFYQVYGAGRQMKIYTEGRWFTYYAPGKTWNILYNPNTACGTAPVYVENKATAALYYYTPYQPNRAALSAGYGEGDGCSSYGNRNFYQYFTDWFGSTQSGSLVQGSGRPEIYLLSGGYKYHVATLEDLTTLRSGLGPVTAVSAAYVDALPSGQDIERYVHDPRTGTLYLLEPDGTKHRFTSSEQINAYGYTFSSYVNLDPGLADRFATGAEVTDFFRPWNSGDVYLYEGGQKRHIATTATWVSVSAGTSGFIATMSPTAAAALPMGPVSILPNSLVRASSSGDVMLVLPSGAMLRIPSFALAKEFGATRYSVLSDASLSANPVMKGVSLTPIVLCDGKPFLAVGGSLQGVDGSDYGGISPTSLSVQDCAAFAKGTQTFSSPIFVQAAGHPEIYALDGGLLRHARTQAILQHLNASRPLKIATWSADTVKAVGVGAPYLEEGVFVQFSGLPEVYRYASNQLHHVRDFATLLSLNGGRLPAILAIPQSGLSAYTVGAPIIGQGTFVQFAGLPEVYQFSNSQLHHVVSRETLLRLGGGRVPAIGVIAATYKSAYTMGAPIP
ncbi:hypothetical protein [Microbacterium sp.]|uniref:hypothetical protein n=1 Tax=Microbacterium sp. TaxID=51671 RepID=UPI003C76FECB